MDLESARHYLALMFEGVPGTLEIRSIEPDGPARRRFCADAEDSIRAIECGSLERHNVYCGVATRRNSEGGGKDNLQAVRALWVDVDFKEEGDAAALEAALCAFPLQPSLVIATGGGRHIYWRLEDPFALDADENVRRFEHVLKGLADALRGDRAATDASRVLRIPGTDNVPDAKKRSAGRSIAPTAILDSNERVFQFDDFEDFELRGMKLGSNGEAKSYERRTWNGALPKSVEHVFKWDLKAKKRFHRDEHGLERASASEVDFSLAVMLAYHKLSGADIEAALRSSRDAAEIPQKHDAYYRITVQNALAAAAGDSTSEDAESERPTIALTEQQLDTLTEQIVTALVEANDPPHLFMRGGAVTIVRRDEHRNPVASPLNDSGLLDVISTSATFVSRTERGFKAARPSRALAGVIAARLIRIEGRLPALSGITESPLMRADGSILNRAGYDAASQLYYAPSRGFELPEVPEDPEPHEIEQAVMLIGEVIADFPFAGNGARAAGWAALLIPPLRELVGGLVPMILIDAPAPGTGKGLLADCVSVIATGGCGAKMPEPGGRDDSEWRKRLTAILLEGRTVLIVDNIERPIGSSALATVLTAEVYQDRVLGRSEIVTVPNRACWFATGNNIRLRGDLPRRCVWCRLDAQVARPWEREWKGFRHPNLLEWVEENRGQILAAIFTLARAWISAGRPGPHEGTPELGSYEKWRHTIGGILRIAEIPGFLANQEALYEGADEDTPQWAAFVETWYETYGSTPVTVAHAALDIRDNRKPELLGCLPTELVSYVDQPSFTRRLGSAMARKQDTRFLREEGSGTLRIAKAGSIHRAVQWVVVSEG